MYNMMLSSGTCCCVAHEDALLSASVLQTLENERSDLRNSLNIYTHDIFKLGFLAGIQNSFPKYSR